MTLSGLQHYRSEALQKPLLNVIQVTHGQCGDVVD
jgi:hypothetical protein